MVEKLEVQGEWWLPGDEEHRVPGWLTWDVVNGGTLSLSAKLRRDEWLENTLADGSVQRVLADKSEDFDKRYPLIHGQFDNRCFALLNSFSLSVRRLAVDDLAVEKVHVNALLESSAWFTDEDDLTFTRVSVDLRNLTAWVGHSGFDAEHPTNEGRYGRFAIITAKRLPPFEVAHDDGKLRVAQSLGGSGDHVYSLGVEERWVARLVYPSLRPIQAFVDTVSDIRDLVSIAVGKAAHIDEFVLQHPDVPALSLAGTQIGDLLDKVTYRACWANWSDDEPLAKSHEMYFSFDDIGGIDGISRWLGVAEQYRTELGRVMATRYSKSMYLEDRIMNVCAALESFDKVRRSTGTDRILYIDVVKECTAFAGQQFADLIAEPVGDWAKRVKETRHDLAHHRDRFRLTGSVGEHLLSEQLFWLFAMCMLRAANLPEPVFDKIIKHQRVRWLAEQAQQRNQS